MIKKLKIEFIIFALLIINIFVSYNIDLGLYLYFKNFNQSLEKFYLKDFFIRISTLGNSFWYYLLSFLLLGSTFIIKKTKFNNFLKLGEIRKVCYFLIIGLTLNGLITQIIKHIVGRSRPNHTDFSGSFGFDFFTLDSSFHSFPSGHTSTIFILALMFSFFVPRLKYFFLFFASVVALSRVVVGAHFFTDIIGGVVVAFVSYKLITLWFYKNFSDLLPQKKININNNLFALFLIVFLFVALLLTIGSSFDLFFSGLFYKESGRFVLQSYYLITIAFREILLPIILIYILILPIISKIIPINKLFFNYNFSVKDILFVWLSLFLNLIIIVNIFLKMFWGRPRPGDTLQLGGKENFFSWFEISSACNTNCSFVSGDASVGFSLVVLYFVTNNSKYFYLSIIFGLLLGLVRIAEGGHFLSDVVFAGIFVFVFSFFLKKYFTYKFL